VFWPLASLLTLSAEKKSKMFAFLLNRTRLYTSKTCGSPPPPLVREHKNSKIEIIMSERTSSCDVDFVYDYKSGETRMPDFTFPNPKYDPNSFDDETKYDEEIYVDRRRSQADRRPVFQWDPTPEGRLIFSKTIRHQVSPQDGTTTTHMVLKPAIDGPFLAWRNIWLCERQNGDQIATRWKPQPRALTPREEQL
jgi:hypothetical protein